MEISKRLAYLGMLSVAIILALLGSGLTTINNYAYAGHEDDEIRPCHIPRVYPSPPCLPPSDSLPI